MKDSTKKEIYSWIKSIAFALMIVFICRQFLFEPSTVFGESMAPTFEDKDKVMVNKITKIKRFDIIVFDAPDVDDSYYIKRVIGLPGDQIEMKNDVLYINDEEMEEPYLTENKEDSPFPMLTENFSLEDKTGKSKVPEDMLFVMGDNRLVSRDSRAFGFIPLDSVVGEVQFRYYPLQHIGIPE